MWLGISFRERRIRVKKKQGENNEGEGGRQRRGNREHIIFTMKSESIFCIY